MTENLEVWENVYGAAQWGGRYPHESLVRFIYRYFGQGTDRRALKVLELGSGAGPQLWCLAREGFQVYGIEGSTSATERSIEWLKAEQMEDRIGAIISGNYEHIPFEDEFFDAIIDIESLYCNSFKTSQNILENAFRKLKSGGKFFSLTFADGTYGVEGEEVDYHAVIPQTGPMAGKGFTRYTTRDDIEVLYVTEHRELLRVERYDRVLEDGHVLKEWAIELNKR